MLLQAQMHYLNILKHGYLQILNFSSSLDYTNNTSVWPTNVIGIQETYLLGL